jgi:hypothetical protein
MLYIDCTVLLSVAKAVEFKLDIFVTIAKVISFATFLKLKQ